tara:strand:- start:4419 stop:4739 length:321 start_codon:yes stop_codon:yes gene_type:complete
MAVPIPLADPRYETSTGGWFDDIVGSVSDFWDTTTNAAESFYEKYIGFELAQITANAAVNQAQGQAAAVAYSPSSNAAAGPFAGVSTETLVIIAGVGLVALVLLRK